MVVRIIAAAMVGVVGWVSIEKRTRDRGERNMDDVEYVSKKRPRDSASDTADSNDGEESSSDGSSSDGKAAPIVVSRVRSSASIGGSVDESDGRSRRSSGPRSEGGADRVGAAKKQSRDDYRRERREIHDALEHLMVVGNAWRHHDWRLRQWRDTARPEELRRTRLHLNRPLVHPRDEREYSAPVGGRGLPNPEAPGNQRDRLQAMDDDWDAACFGDGIRLQEFYDRSLDVLHCPARGLVLRAWERAMSIASNTVTASAAVPSVEEDPMDVVASEVSLQQTPRRKEPASPSPKVHRPRPLTRSMGLAQCALLNLDLEDPNSKVCRTCGVEFDSTDRVRDHYYGDDKVRGCCWILVRREQERLLRQTLQDQVEDQAALLLQEIAAATGEGANPWDWQDVVEAVDRSSNRENVASGARMSPSVADAAMRRLVERYANVPR
jgi:hypothetical protein